MEDERLKNKHYIDSWINGFKGIWYAISTQLNAKIQLVIALIVIICCIYFKLSITECMFLSFATMLIIITEVMNTAVEEVVNLCTNNKYHPIAKIAKDVAAGAVVLSAFNAVIIAIFIIAGRVL